jgi:hypothetical protein
MQKYRFSLLFLLAACQKYAQNRGSQAVGFVLVFAFQHRGGERRR